MGYLRGVNDGGPEFGNPGIAGEVYNTNWHYDGLGTLQYLAHRGHKLVRLPFRWERIQPTRASVGVSTLDSAELGRLTTYIANAASVGISVIVDLHNFCRYNNSSGTTLVMYTDFPVSDFVDVWTKLSTALHGLPGIYGYELMNEPFTLPGQASPALTPQQQWQAWSQTVLSAIRANGDNTLILIDGYSFSAAQVWPTNHPTAWISDPANNFMYTAHHYPGTNANGTFLTYAQENTDAIGNGYTGLPDQAVQRLEHFTNWCTTQGVRGSITEIAWRNDESVSSWNAVGDAMYSVLDGVGMDVTYWATGEWWGFGGTTESAGYYVPYGAVSASSLNTAAANAPTIEAHPSSGGTGTSALIATVTGANGVYATGHAQQRHIVYAPNSAAWWAFWVDPATPSSLQCASSPDLLTWTAGSSLALPLPLVGGDETNAPDGTANGRNFGAVCVANGSTDVLHVAACLYNSTGPVLSLYDCRATLTASAITWGTPVQTITSGVIWTPDGTAPMLAPDGSYLVNTGLPRFPTHNQGNETGAYNATKDTGPSWTPGTWSQYNIEVANASISSHGAYPLSGGTVLWLYDNGATSNAPTNIRWAIASISGTTPTPADVFPTTVTINGNDWGATSRTASDVHCVRRTGANTYEHRRFNGTSWSAGDSIPVHTSLASAGVALTSDGTHVYLAVIDSLAGNAVLQCTWSAGTGWGLWTALVSTVATRAGIAACERSTGAPLAAVIWNENPSGTTYTLRVGGIAAPSSGGGQAPTLVFGRRGRTLVLGSSGAAQLSAQSPVLA